MKTLTDNLIRPRRIPCLLIAVCCKLSAVRNLLHATHHCTSITSVLGGPGNSLKCGLNPFIPSEPNFQNSRLSVTLAMIRTYNESCPKTHKKSKPNPNPIQTQTKPNPNPIPQFYIFLDFFVWGLYNCKVMMLEIELALVILKMSVLIMMKSFFGGLSGPAMAGPDEYHGNGDFNSSLSDRSYLMLRAVPVKADKILLCPHQCNQVA